MTPGAQLAVGDFARLASRESGDLYGVQFLKDGFCGYADRFRDDFPGIRKWEGVTGLKSLLCRFAGAPGHSRCELSSRSSNLMRFAAKAMALRCRNVLVLDLCWEPFQKIAQREFRRSNVTVSIMPLRRVATAASASASEVTTAIVNEYVDRDCDGIFLPAVSHDGVRLPVDTILREIRSVLPTTFAIVDGAQALGHVGTNTGISTANVFLAGAHKWLGAGMPLGIAFIARDVRRLCYPLPSRDPLRRFVEGIEHATRTGNETINVWPLFACHGALQDAVEKAHIENSFKERRWNSAHLRASLSATSWEVQPFHPELSSGIEILRPRALASRHDHGLLRSRLGERGITASTYPGPMIRLSMPDAPFSERAMGQVRHALNF